MNISEKIQLARKQNGFTQESLAEATNLSLSTIKRIENGKVNPRMYTVKVLSDFLELDLPMHDTTSKVSEQEDCNALLVLLSILLSFIPPASIIFLLKYRFSNNESKFFNFIGRKLLMFQIAACILLIISVLLALICSYFLTGQKVYGQVNPSFIAYLVFIGINILSALMIYKKAMAEQMTPE